MERVKKQKIEKALLISPLEAKGLRIKRQVDAIYIGSDICEKILENINIKLLSYLRENFKNKKITLITPLIGEKYFERIFRIIINSMSKGLIDSVCINDAGILSRLIKTTEFDRIELGRIFINTFQYNIKNFISDKITAIHIDSSNNIIFAPDNFPVYFHTPYSYMASSRNYSIICQRDCKRCLKYKKIEPNPFKKDLYKYQNGYFRKNINDLKKIRKSKKYLIKRLIIPYEMV